MNRTIITVAATLGSLTPLLFDSALKGAVLLAVAALGALTLWRASAATRHLVWLVAIVALLMVPVLSVALPQWRVLPGWAAGPGGTQGTQGTQDGPTAAAPTALLVPAAAAAPMPESSAILPPSPRRGEAASAAVPSVPVVPLVPAPRHWLAPAWAAGFTLLALRLLAAHLLLRRATRRCSVVAVRPPSGDPDGTGGEERMTATLSAACAQLGLRQRVTLLLDEARAIPVVWGVIRPHLLLPAEAREWSDEQLRSVVLHELAHIRRRDTLVQWLTQTACALHWWNPLVWVAAWRLHVERERACDDLVLASGVRPSAYAEHLLHVATRLSPARWTSACGLAMARKSSLEGRLVAVLSDRLNRRGVTTALAAAALLLAAGIAVPVAMLRAAEPEKPKTEASSVNAEPKDAESKSLFNEWKTGARSDGRIPGGRIGEMAASLKDFMALNPGHEQSVRLEPVVKKCDASRDWTPTEAAALLDEIAAITPRAEWVMRAKAEREIHPGKPLPDELATAPWGKPAENGLRTAWLLEPRAETQALDSVMKSRVLFHNAGKRPVCFATDNWIQTGGHKAQDANGKAISVWALERMGIRLRMIFRLAPGEYAEVEGHGLGVGSHETSSEKSIYKVGCWIEAKEGDTVTFTPGKLPVSFATWMEPEGRKDSRTVWQEMIAKRVALESPMPAGAADREGLLRRVLLDLLGTAPTSEESASFVADNAAEALAKLTARLHERAGAMPFAGELSGGATTFRVTAAAAKEKPKPGAAAGVQPRHEYAQSLFKKWQAKARTDGKIPGALIGHVTREVDNFIKQYPRDVEATPKLVALRPRLDASRDWEQAEVVALLDDLTAISTAPVSWADIPMEFSAMRAIQAGQPLPLELKSAAWGQPAANGLRAAWLLEPRAEQYALGSVLKARVLFQNVGKEPVVFKTETWHQDDPHTARDGNGGDIKVGSTWYTGVTPVATFRLAPYEYCEVQGHGIAIGAGQYPEEHSLGSVGAVIEAKEGDVVGFSSLVDASYGGWTRPDDPKDPAELWRKTIAERIANEAPMPASAADRQQLIRRVTLDLLGLPPTPEEIAAFTADNAPDALAKLLERLLAKQWIEPFVGKLPTGVTTFRVIAADPEAAKAPRTANAPGRYVLGDSVHLLVSQTTEGDRQTNKATIAFLSPDPKVASPHKPHEIALPDGLGTYGIVWDRGSNALWIMQKGLVRKYEFANPSQVQEVRYDPGSLVNIPEHLHEPLKKAWPDTAHEGGRAGESTNPEHKFTLGASGSAQPPQEAPNTGLMLKPATEQKLKWGEPVNGLRMALAWPPTLGEAGMGHAPEFYLVVQNVSEAAVRLAASDAAPNPRRLMMRDKGSPMQGLRDTTPMPGDWLLQPREVAFVRLFQQGEKEKGGRITSAAIEDNIRAFPQYSMTAEMSIEKAPAGAWTGKLSTGETRGSADVIPPKRQDVPLTPPPAATAPASENPKTEKLKDGADAPKQQQDSQPPKQGAKLTPGTEEKLDWSEPVNGLRVALTWPPTLGEPGAGEVPDFLLAVQNVSTAPVRLCTTAEAPSQRRLTFSTAGVIQFRTLSAEPNGVDAILGPRQVVFLRLFMEGAKETDKVPHGSAIAAAVRQGAEVKLLADMEITNAPAGAWTGKLVTPWTRAGIGAEAPKNRRAQELFKVWLQHARVNGKIPGGHVSRLGDRVREFVRGNLADKAGEPYAKRMEPLVARLDGSRDWQPAEASALLNEIAAVSDAPLSVMLEETAGGTIQYSLPLKPELETAPWGEALPNGLRVACLFEPRVAEHRLGTPLKMRILVHNAGKEPVVVRTRTWHHIEPTARAAKGAEIKMESVTRLTLAPLVAYRLMPGRVIELASPGIGIGRYGYHDFKDADVASWIGVSAGGEVTLTPGPVPLSDWNEAPVLDGEPRWWLDFISARLNLATPLPHDAAERTQLLQTAVREFFQDEATAEEIAAFVADRAPHALEALAERLSHRPGLRAWAGSLTSGPTTFRVTAAGPGGDKPAAKPATAQPPPASSPPDEK